MYAFVQQSKAARVIVTVIALATVGGFVYGIWVVFTGHSFEYFQYQQRAQELNGKVLVSVHCSNDYTWQVRYSAYARASSFEQGPAELVVRNHLVLLDANSQEVTDTSDNQAVADKYLRTLLPFQFAYLSGDVFEQMKAWSRPEYRSVMGPQLWSFFFITPARVSIEDFRVVAECLADSYTTLNSAYIANTPARQALASKQFPIGGLYLMDSAAAKRSVKVMCDNSAELDFYGEALSLIKRNKDEHRVSAVVGLDGVIRASVEEAYTSLNGESTYHTVPTEKTQLDEFHAIEQMVERGNCHLNLEKKKLLEIIQTLPQRVKVFPTQGYHIP